MTAVLVDTHTLVWALIEPARLGAKARRVLTDPAVDVLVSAVSAWEISTKVRLKRFPEAQALVAGLEQHLTTLGAIRLPISVEHGLLAGALDWPHPDPFDRMLVAQAMTENVPLVTKDRAMQSAGVSLVW